MQDLIKEIKEVRRRTTEGELSVSETIVLLSDIMDKFNASNDDYSDSEKGYLKSLFKNKKIKEIDAKNEKAKKRVKNLKILVLLKDIGFDKITEQDIEKTLKGI